MKKLAVIVLGERNSGKSKTWYELFGRKIKTGKKKIQLKSLIIPLFVRNSSFEEMGIDIYKYFEVFVRNSSFEEIGIDAADFFDTKDLPQIVLCSVQYVEKGITTINWFKENGYYLYIQWLNPGHSDEETYPDDLEFEKKFSSSGIFIKCSGKETDDRVNKIKEFLSDWVYNSK